MPAAVGVTPARVMSSASSWRPIRSRRSSSSTTTTEPAPLRCTSSRRSPGVARSGSSASATSRRSATPTRVGRSRCSSPADDPPKRDSVTQGSRRRAASGRRPAARARTARWLRSAALRRTGSTSSSQPVARRTRWAEAGQTASRAAATCSSVSTSSRWIAATGCIEAHGQRGANRGGQLGPVGAGQPVRHQHLGTGLVGGERAHPSRSRPEGSGRAPGPDASDVRSGV